MDSVNKTLYIPLYGKAYVSKRNMILEDPKAKEIWEKVGFELKGKSKSKWLAYYMAMRAAVYDEWVREEIRKNPAAIVMHIGCGMDSRIRRVAPDNTQWYDIDFPEVIEERRKYYEESDFYHMLAADMRTEEWRRYFTAESDAIIIMEGISMYFKQEELTGLLSALAKQFQSVRMLMDCYTQKAAKASKYRNPINEVGVTVVYGYDNPEELAEQSGLVFEQEKSMTPQKYIDELQGAEKVIFRNLFAGGIAKSMYRIYEYKKTADSQKI